MPGFGGPKKGGKPKGGNTPSSGTKKLAAIARNPFEAKGNKKVKFDVLGRRVKGAERNVALARSDAIARRNNTLLAELKSLGKSNAFVDKRFGEKDPTLDDDSKNLVRFQKERMRQLNVGKRAKKFNLDSDAADGGAGKEMQLTHFGRALSDMDAFDQRPAGAGDDSGSEDEMMDTSIHFGGPSGGANGDGGGAGPSWRGQKQLPAWAASGQFAAGGGDGGDGAGGEEQERKKSYKEVMEEVIAKSKAARADRAREKAEQADILSRLDSQVNEVARLLGAKKGRGGSYTTGDDADNNDNDPANWKPAFPVKAATAGATSVSGAAAASSSSSSASTSKPSSAAAEEDGESAPDAGYDALLTQLAMQPRGAAARDRSKTAEELASEEADRLRELEDLRRMRARGEGGAGAGGDDAGAAGSRPGVSGVYASMASGDDLGPEQDMSGTTHKQRKAAGSKVSIWDYAKKAKEEEEDEDDDEEDDSSSSDDDSSSDGDDDGAAAGSGEQEDEEGDDSNDDDGAADGSLDSDEEEIVDEDDADLFDESGEEGADGGDDDDAAMDEEEDESVQTKTKSATSKVASAPAAPASAKPASKASSSASSAAAAPRAEMPFTIACPTTHSKWDAMVVKYCAPRAAGSINSSKAGQKRPRSDETADADGAAGDSGEEGVAACAGRVSEMLRRIRALHNVALDAGHKRKLEGMYTALLEDVKTIGDAAAPLPLWRLEPIAQHLFSMSQEGALRSHAGAAWKSIAKGIAGRVQEDINRPLPGPTGPSPAWLTGGELLLLRIASTLFPATDFRHPILASLTLAACQCLAQAPVCSLVDLARGLLVASAVADLTRGGRRYAPELVAFLQSTLAVFAGRGTAGGLPVALPIAIPSFAPLQRNTAAAASTSLLRMALSSSASSSTKIPLSIASSASTSAASSSSLATACLLTALSLAEDVTTSILVPHAFTDASNRAQSNMIDAALAPNGNAAKGVVRAGISSFNRAAAAAASNGFAISGSSVPMPCAPEVIDPLVNAMAAIVAQVQGQSKGSAAAGAITKAVTATMKTLVTSRDAVAAVRTPLRMHEQSGPPPSIKMYAPLLEDVNAPNSSLALAMEQGRRGKKLDAATEEARAKEEVRRLSKAVKKEKRGAARELRRDREFIVRAGDDARKVRDKERDAKYREVMHDLEVQQASLRQQVKTSKSKPLDAQKSAEATSKMHWVGEGKTGKTKADRMARKETSRTANQR